MPWWIAAPLAIAVPIALFGLLALGEVLSKMWQKHQDINVWRGKKREDLK
jgi:hypothetical protein